MIPFGELAKHFVCDEHRTEELSVLQCVETALKTISDVERPDVVVKSPIVIRPGLVGLREQPGHAAGPGLDMEANGILSRVIRNLAPVFTDSEELRHISPPIQ